MNPYLCAALVFVVCFPAAHSIAAGDPGDLDLTLSIFPRVDRVVFDRWGRPVVLEGLLTPPGDGLPRQVAESFMTIHRDLFAAAGQSEFVIESVLRQGDRSTVVLRQVVDGFSVEQEALWLAFQGSELVSVRGVVVRHTDVVPMSQDPLPRDAAIAIANTDLPFEHVAISTTAQKVMVGDHYLRCWRVETVFRSNGDTALLMALVDAVDGAVIQRETHRLEEFVPAGGPDGGGSGLERMTGCEPVTPPVGEFSSAQGQSLWQGADTGCGQWVFDRGRSASFFHGNCMEYECDPYPSTSDCDHGEIRRRGLAFGPDYERVRIVFPTPDRDVFMRLRWGPGENQAVPFVVTEGQGPSTVIDVDLGRNRSWVSEDVSELILEMVDDHSIWIKSLDLFPGPWLEFDGEPEMATLVPGSGFIEGGRAAIYQDVRNTGCALDDGAHPEMRETQYTLFRLLGFGWQFHSVVCDSVQITGDIPAGGSLENLPMCGFELPAPGTWKLVGSFPHHPSPSTSVRFDVQPADGPNLAVHGSVPIDLYSGDLLGWSCRVDLLDLARYTDPDPECGLPYVIALRVGGAGLDAPTTSMVRAWGRPVNPSGNPTICDPDSEGWVELGDPRSWVFGAGGDGIVDLPLDRDRVEDLTLGPHGWALLDLLVAVDPIDGETDVSDNVLCVASWIPIVDSGLDDSIGPTWIDDDYFLDPEHWPPSGLTWSGMTVDHEEGAAGYDPDSALLEIAVDDGANEAPRLVWYEERPGETVTGLLVRYRRNDGGFGGEPFFDAGAEEADGIPLFDIEPSGHGNRSAIVADSQWRTVVWRRQAEGPFGPYVVPFLATPGRTGDTLSLHMTTDTNCLLDEPGCPSGLHPETLIDIVGGWFRQGEVPPEPVFVVGGLRMWTAAGWQVLPPEIDRGDNVELAVLIQNVGSATGSADLFASVHISPLGESSFSQVVTGSAVVTISPGGSYHLGLEPVWVPGAVGNFGLNGEAFESGQSIGHLWSTVRVVEESPGCAVPVLDLP